MDCTRSIHFSGPAALGGFNIWWTGLQIWGFESDQVRLRFGMMMMMLMMMLMMLMMMVMMMMLTSDVSFSMPFKTCQNRQYYSYERDEHLELGAIL